MSHISKAAAERLAKGIQPGDFVLLGEYTIKLRVPYETAVKGSRDGYARTLAPQMGKVLEVTPTGRLNVEFPEGGGGYLLPAKESLRAVKMTPEQVERRRRCLPGWE